MKPFDIRNSIAFITGVNKPNGIGRAIVQTLLAQGARKVYATARSAAQLDDLVAQSDGKVVAVALDVTDAATVAQLGQRFGDVQLLINNAGFFAAVGALQDARQALQEIEVNYLAPLRITQSFAPVLRRQERSALVNINSIASLVNVPVAGTYSASKAASHSLTQAQRRELAGTLVVGVYPGPIATEMAREIQMDKSSPKVVAEAIAWALQQGVEDVFPDPTAKQLHAGWQADAKAVELQMATEDGVAEATGASA